MTNVKETRGARNSVKEKNDTAGEAAKHFKQRLLKEIKNHHKTPQNNVSCNKCLSIFMTRGNQNRYAAACLFPFQGLPVISSEHRRQR